MAVATDQFGILAKYWQVGEVKTRLAKDVGEGPAAALHRIFLSTLLQRFAESGLSCVLCFAPSDRRKEFAQLAGDSWRLEPQTSGDLGARMAAYFHSAFNRGFQRVVLIGSDSPTLPRAWIADAFKLLEKYRVVLGPSADGGYYLVGAATEVPPIFDGMAWSTGNVWEETCRRLTESGIPMAQLPAWYDVDTVGDLQRLATDLSWLDGNELQDSPEFTELMIAVNAALGTRD